MGGTTMEGAQQTPGNESFVPLPKSSRPDGGANRSACSPRHSACISGGQEITLGRALCLSLVAALGLAGCSEEYAYAPATTSNAMVAGVPAADYPLPPPDGDVRLATLGVTDAHPADAPTSSAKAVHVRVIATNRGTDGWTIDAREQRVAFADGVQVAAGNAFAGAGPEGPVLRIAPRTVATIDLYFLLPQALRKPSARPGFTVRWIVHMPARTIEESTSFDRFEDETEADVTGRWGGSSSPSR
jgi:hypothetical protein